MINPQLSKPTTLLIIFLIVLAAVGLAVAGLPAPETAQAAAGPGGPVLEALPPPGYAHLQATVGYTFTYQGRLEQETGPVDSTCDLTFKLFDSPSGGSQVGSDVTNSSVVVQDGYFTQPLNFGGGMFDGSARWLEITINSCNGDSGSGGPLSPRVALSAAPYALYALDGPWGSSGSGGWNLTGNSGTSPGTHFLGTTDVTSLTLAVNNTPGLRLAPGGSIVPNVIGGSVSNVISDSKKGSVIGGGGHPNSPNRITGDYATIGGGRGNQAAAPDATVSGGRGNQAAAPDATVSGGRGNQATEQYATVGGGWDNQATGEHATVGGGSNNRATGYRAAVGGGGVNQATGENATVGGGLANVASFYFATVGGGYSNVASGDTATMGGGFDNDATGSYATVGGGYSNVASGDAATVPGGRDNTAAGNFSFAAGRRAKANHDGSFVWGDSIDADITSGGANQFTVRASGGVFFYSNSGATSGAFLAPGTGAWATLSDRNAKENFAPVDSRAVLEDLAGIPLETWNYKTQADDIRHIGPMAQDFYAAFEVGENNTTISTVDADGVALAAIQGLYQRLQAAEAENAALQQQVNDLEARLAALEAGLSGGAQ